MMTKSLRERAESATREVNSIIGVSADDHSKEVADAIEQTIINALLEERHRCADVALKCCEDDQDKAHQISEEIRRVNTALMANLSALR
ncbi:MAG: hypothetical protein HOL66_09050 [Rhodospirillaceae bacterium]|jgi:hypothetical protein|nr:hypothetical protein [Rhodospirillaceae bacterium]MBT5244381.1 hypothetical protein [Rhodospirillaceae bacterium]MBT5563742.1 hypothetical protein [Rhodospirillaceae bacterium]MBT6241572.1 hypothetical protein [Rhodospirillaceae bacterium]MBT7138537.1 hypothetical protein [Rhodospirillaceae bacterium]